MTVNKVVSFIREKDMRAIESQLMRLLAAVPERLAASEALSERLKKLEYNQGRSDARAALSLGLSIGIIVSLCFAALAAGFALGHSFGVKP